MATSDDRCPDDGAPRASHAAPVDTIRAWLPHLVMLGMLALAVTLVAMVFAPLRDPVLLAGSFAAMSYAIVFLPIHRLTTRLLPGVIESWRRRISAGLATAVVVALLISPVALLLVTGLAD